MTEAVALVESRHDVEFLFWGEAAGALPVGLLALGLLVGFKH